MDRRARYGWGRKKCFLTRRSTNAAPDTQGPELGWALITRCGFGLFWLALGISGVARTRAGRLRGRLSGSLQRDSGVRRGDRHAKRARSHCTSAQTVPMLAKWTTEDPGAKREWGRDSNESLRWIAEGRNKYSGSVSPDAPRTVADSGRKGWGDGKDENWRCSERPLLDASWALDRCD